MRGAVVVGLVLLIAGPAAPAGAAVIHVETTGSDSATCGAAVATACLTITKAIARTPAGPEDVRASSAYQAGADDPDELRSTIDRQTLRIKILRPPDSDVVPYVVPDDDTLTPGQVVDLVERIINDGNRPAPRVRACLRLDAKFDQQTGRCQTVRRLDPGEGIYRRIRLRVPLRRLRRTRHAPPAGHGQRSPGAHRPRDGSRPRRAVRQRALPDGANRLDAPAPARDRSDRVLTCARCSS